ncbi:MAG: undecaprenyl-diphosphate phosphatase, partial [bacterium]|nr:undecaprenyl-diphosphate phosphatase [bacterium]
MFFLKTIVLAVIEGVTEFLPISSTGHLILAEEFMTLGADKVFADAFLVIIQLPAIFSVVLYFWDDLWPFGKGGVERAKRLGLWVKVVVAFVPAAVLGVLFSDVIDQYLFAPTPVAVALMVGGLVFIVLEKRPVTTHCETVHDIGFGRAIAIGLFQCLAMIPGTSRSGATIIGGMAVGASRAAAAEFSFFLAIPTMLGATVYTLVKIGVAFTPVQWAA